MVASLRTRGIAARISASGARYLWSLISIPGFASSLCRHPFAMLIMAWCLVGFFLEFVDRVERDTDNFC